MEDLSEKPDVSRFSPGEPSYKGPGDLSWGQKAWAHPIDTVTEAMKPTVDEMRSRPGGPSDPMTALEAAGRAASSAASGIASAARGAASAIGGLASRPDNLPSEMPAASADQPAGAMPETMPAPLTPAAPAAPAARSPAPVLSDPMLAPPNTGGFEPEASTKTQPSPITGQPSRGGTPEDPMLAGSRPAGSFEPEASTSHYNPDASPWENFWKAARMGAWNADWGDRQNAIFDTIADTIQRVKELKGETIPNPLLGGFRDEAAKNLGYDPFTLAVDKVGGMIPNLSNSNLATVGVFGSPLMREQLALYQKRLNEIAAAASSEADGGDKALLAAIHAGLNMDAAADAHIKTMSEKYAADYAKSTGNFIPWFASFLGDMWGATTRDPINRIGLLVGPGESAARSAIVRTIEQGVKQGVIQAGLTAAQEPGREERRKELSQETGFWPVLRDEVGSFLGGAIPGSIIHGIGEGWLHMQGLTTMAEFERRLRKSPNPDAPKSWRDKIDEFIRKKDASWTYDNATDSWTPPGPRPGQKLLSGPLKDVGPASPEDIAALDEGPPVVPPAPTTVTQAGIHSATLDAEHAPPVDPNHDPADVLQNYEGQIRHGEDPDHTAPPTPPVYVPDAPPSPIKPDTAPGGAVTRTSGYDGPDQDAIKNRIAFLQQAIASGRLTPAEQQDYESRARDFQRYADARDAAMAGARTPEDKQTAIRALQPGDVITGQEKDGRTHTGEISGWDSKGAVVVADHLGFTRDILPATISDIQTGARQSGGGARAPTIATDQVTGLPVHLNETFDPLQLKTDAQAYQYKGGGDEAGVTSRLKGSKWDNMATGKIVVHERLDGHDYVADGHQRTGLAKEEHAAGRLPPGTRLIGDRLREADGWTVEKVRAAAAKKNLQEGGPGADVIDVARVLRDHPEIWDKSLPVSDPKLKQGKGLAELSDEAWKLVLNGQVKPNYGSLVGLGVDKENQVAVMDDIVKFKPVDENAVRMLIADANAGGYRKDDLNDLFGTQVTRSLAGERAAVFSNIMKLLRDNRRIFAMLDREQTRIEAAGNTLAGENAAIADRAERLGLILEKLATRQGPVSAALNRSAADVAAGMKPLDAARLFLTEIDRLIKEEGLKLEPGPPTAIEPRPDIDTGTPEGQAQQTAELQAAAARRKAQEEADAAAAAAEAQPPVVEPTPHPVAEAGHDLIKEVTGALDAGGTPEGQAISDVIKAVEPVVDELFPPTPAAPEPQTPAPLRLLTPQAAKALDAMWKLKKPAEPIDAAMLPSVLAEIDRMLADRQISPAKADSMRDLAHGRDITPANAVSIEYHPVNALGSLLSAIQSGESKGGYVFINRVADDKTLAFLTKEGLATPTGGKFEGGWRWLLTDKGKQIRDGWGGYGRAFSDDIRAMAEKFHQAMNLEAPARPEPAPVPSTKAPEIVRGTVGMKLGPGQIVLTASGRQTTPFPKIALGTDRNAAATVKRVNQWLMDNATLEARARGDEFNAPIFEANSDNPQQADRDSAEEYLFGEQPAVLPPVLKPLVTPTPTAPEPLVTSNSGVELHSTVDLPMRGLKPKRRADGGDASGAAQVAWASAQDTGKPATVVLTHTGWSLLRPGEKVPYGTPRIIVTPDGQASFYQTEKMGPPPTAEDYTRPAFVNALREHLNTRPGVEGPDGNWYVIIESDDGKTATVYRRPVDGEKYSPIGGGNIWTVDEAIEQAGRIAFGEPAPPLADIPTPGTEVGPPEPPLTPYLSQDDEGFWYISFGESGRISMGQGEKWSREDAESALQGLRDDGGNFGPGTKITPPPRKTVHIDGSPPPPQNIIEGTATEISGELPKPAAPTLEDAQAAWAHFNDLLAQGIATPLRDSGIQRHEGRTSFRDGFEAAVTGRAEPRYGSAPRGFDAGKAFIETPEGQETAAAFANAVAVQQAHEAGVRAATPGTKSNILNGIEALDEPVGAPAPADQTPPTSVERPPIAPPTPPGSSASAERYADWQEAGDRLREKYGDGVLDIPDNEWEEIGKIHTEAVRLRERELGKEPPTDPDYPTSLTDEEFDALREDGWAVADARAAGAPPSEKKDPKEAFVDAIKARLAEGEQPFKTIVEARKLATDLGLSVPEGASTNKLVDELVERAVVERAREIVAAGRAGALPPAETFAKIVKLYEAQPNLATRTSTSVAEQAYSTPAPLAYVASRLAGISPGTHVLEPTAGNGMLLMEADPKLSVVNELNPTRAAALEAQGFRPTVKDATSETLFADRAGQMDSVIANPPFGTVLAGGKPKTFAVDNWRTDQVDHAIAMNALKAMKADGRAVLIVGGIKSEDLAERQKAYGGQSKRRFYFQLLENYNVTDIFTVSGDLYAKQGAGWPVDVIVIEGKGKSSRDVLTKSPPPILKSWDEVGAKLNGITKADPAAPGSTEPDRGSGRSPVEGEREPGAGNGVGRRPSAGAKPVVGGGPVEGSQGSGGVGGGGAGGKSGHIRDQPPVGEGAGQPPGGSGDVHSTNSKPNSNGRRPVDDDAPQTDSPDYGANNTFIKKDQAEKLAARLKALLKDAANKMSSGMDPELFAIGAQLAAYHIEAGARSFAKFTRAMMDQLGMTFAELRPGLRFWYNGARDLMEDAGLDISKMDSREVVAAELARLDAEAAAPPPPKPPAPPKRETNTDGQTTYMPASRTGMKLNTLLPANLRDATLGALARVEAEHGRVDEYVARELGYQTDQEGMYFLNDKGDRVRPFSAEQIDAIALGISNIEKGDGFIIGDQCVAGETRIFDPVSGAHTPIKDLCKAGKPITVLSATREGFRASRASAPFLKGVADLYRVTLDDGASIIVTRGHRFLSDSGWRSLDAGLAVGDLLVTPSSSPSVLSAGIVGLSLPACARADGLRSTGEESGSPDRYSRNPRPCGGRLPLEEDSAQASSPSRADALERTHCYSHTGDLGFSREHSRPHRAPGLPSRNSSSPSGSRGLSLTSSQEPSWSVRASPMTPREPEPSLHETALPRPEVTGASADQRDGMGRRLSSSWGDHTGIRRIVSIEFERHDEFFDMYVPETMNYVAEGIVNHNTGIGKGRVVAGMISYAKAHGMVPLFVTEKPDLYGDMWRDLHDIGWDRQLGRPINMMMTNANTRIPLDEEALDWTIERNDARAEGREIPPMSGTFSASQISAAAATKMTSLINGSLVQDVVFSTYDQMNSVKGLETPRRAFLAEIAPRAFLIMDEAHNAGGNANGPGMFQAKDKAPPRSDVFRQAVTAARAVMYSSATYAKSPAVMTLYSRTDMAKAVEKASQLPELIGKGGVPLQQVVASMLAQAGQYLRRERSFEGIEYAQESVPVSETAYSEFTTGIRSVFEFDRAFEEERKHLADEIAQEYGGGKSADSGVGDVSASSTSFSSVMHNIIGQMITALKAERIGQRAIEALKAGEKPVIALSKTNEAFLKEFIETAGLKNGDVIDVGFRDILKKYLERTRRITIKLGNDEKIHVMIPLSKMSTEMVDMYRAAEDTLRDIEIGELPVSPIDHIRDTISRAGYTIREITGRGTMLDYSGDKPVIVRRPASEEGSVGKKVTVKMFIDGRLDAVIGNKSMSTGISMHASPKFKDLRRRRMILGEADPNIDTHMQMLGRVHRTGQIIPPAYTHLTADIPAEVRPTAVLMRKMASLNANTTGAAKSRFTSEAVDFLNKYGDQVVDAVLNDDLKTWMLLGSPIPLGRETAAPETAATVTGKLTLLMPDEQQAFLDRVVEEYKALIAALDAAGENDLEAKSLDLQAIIKDTQVVKAATGLSPFQSAVNLDTASVKAIGRAMEPREVLGHVSTALQTPLTNADYPAQMKALSIVGYKAKNTLVAATEKAEEEYRRQVIRGLKDAKAKDNALTKSNEAVAKFRRISDIAFPGATVILHFPNGSETPAVVIRFKRKDKAIGSPVSASTWELGFALPNSTRSVMYPMSRVDVVGAPQPKAAPGGAEAEAKAGSVTISRNTEIPHTDMEARFTAARKEGREDRYMISGNILAGYEQTRGKGQIITHTMADGSTRPAILMNKDFDPQKFMENRPVRFVDGAHVLRFLDAVPRGEVKSTDGIITIKKSGYSYYEFAVPAPRAIGGRYFTDLTIQNVLGAQVWAKKGTTKFGISEVPAMRVTVSAERAEKLIDAMRDLDALFEVRENQEAAVRTAPQVTAPAAAAQGKATPNPMLKMVPDEDGNMVDEDTMMNAVPHDTVLARVISECED